MNKDFEIVKKKVCSLVIRDLDFSIDINENDIYRAIDDALMNIPEKTRLTLPEAILLRTEAFNSLKKYDAIQEYLEDDTVTEIMINGQEAIFIEKNGQIEKTDKQFESKDKLEDVIQQMVSECNRSVNEAAPIQDARLSTGERVNIVLPPVAINGPIVTIRRFPDRPITMEKLIELKSLTEEAATFLKRLVCAKYNIFISGGTGTGKTTFLNALSQYIPLDERVITIEDSAELRILNAENLVRLETRNKNSEGCRDITIRDLIKTALRMRPDRIIVGEVRGAEAVDMLAAMNTGHDGSLSIRVYVLEEQNITLLLDLVPGTIMYICSAFFKGSIGKGDALMLLFIGSVMGYYQELEALFISVILTGLLSLILIIAKKANRKTEIPFVPFLSIGVIAGGLI